METKEFQELLTLLKRLRSLEKPNELTTIADIELYCRLHGAK